MFRRLGLATPIPPPSLGWDKPIPPPTPIHLPRCVPQIVESSTSPNATNSVATDGHVAATTGSTATRSDHPSSPGSDVTTTTTSQSPMSTPTAPALAATADSASLYHSHPHLASFLQAIIRPTQLSLEHFEALGLHVIPDAPVEELVPDASVVPDFARWEKLTADEAYEIHEHTRVPLNNGNLAPGVRTYLDRRKELSTANLPAFCTVRRVSAQMGLTPIRLGNSYEFFRQLEAVSGFWDDTSKVDLPPDDGADALLNTAQTMAAEKEKEPMSGDWPHKDKEEPVQEKNMTSDASRRCDENRSNAGPSTRAAQPDQGSHGDQGDAGKRHDDRKVPHQGTTTGQMLSGRLGEAVVKPAKPTFRRTAAGAQMPPSFRNNLISAFLRLVTYDFGCNVSVAGAADQRMYVASSIVPSSLSSSSSLSSPASSELRSSYFSSACHFIFRTPTLREAARSGIVEGPVAGITTRHVTRFPLPSPGTTNRESMIDLGRELVAALVTAQHRARQGRTEKLFGQGSWWACKPRWGGGKEPQAEEQPEDRQQKQARSQSSMRNPFASDPYYAELLSDLRGFCGNAPEQRAKDGKKRLATVTANPHAASLRQNAPGLSLLSPLSQASSSSSMPPSSTYPSSASVSNDTTKTTSSPPPPPPSSLTTSSTSNLCGPIPFSSSILSTEDTLRLMGHATRTGSTASNPLASAALCHGSDMTTTSSESGASGASGGGDSSTSTSTSTISSISSVSTNTNSSPTRLAGKRHRPNLMQAAWRIVRPPAAVWDEKVQYSAIGRMRGVDHDDVFVVSSLFHHVSILRVRVPDRLLQVLEGASERETGPRSWGRLAMWRSRWFDLFKADERIEAMRLVWCMMAYVMRAEADQEPHVSSHDSNNNDHNGNTKNISDDMSAKKMAKTVQKKKNDDAQDGDAQMTEAY